MHPRFQRGEEWARSHSVLVEPHREAICAAVRAGVKVVTGTDSTGVYAEEVQLVREGGMKSMDSILASTRYAAEALGMADRIGTVVEGTPADPVVLDGDPLADPWALERVHMVMKDGRAYRPEEIVL
jgi:imidazolonepropionase-like amidohydrolase